MCSSPSDQRGPTVETLGSGRYRDLRLLGEGGMGRVYAAWDAKLERRVAVKVILPRLATSGHALARFKREARAMARVQHPNVVRILDVGEEEEDLFLVMELLDGTSLDERLGQGPVAAREGLDWAAQAASGLGAVHEAGFAHRDVKPANLFLTQSSGLKVMDLGLALPLDAATRTAITRTGAAVGSLAFMAPEVLRGAQADRRSDVYSLGLVVYQVLTGRQPYDMAGVMALVIGAPAAQPPPPSSLVAGVPRAVDELLAAAMDADPARRPADGRAFAAALSSVRETRRPKPPVASVERPRWRRPAALSGLAFVALAALLARPAARPPELGDLRVTFGALSVGVAWTGASPETLVAEVRGPGGRVAWSGASEHVPSTNHAVRLPRAAWPERGVLAVRARPAGPATTSALPPALPFTLAGPALQPTSTGVQLTWSSSLPLQGLIRLGLVGRAEVERFATGGLAHVASVPVTSRLGSTFTASFSATDAMGDEVTAPPFIMPAVSLDDLHAATARLDEDKAFDRFNRLIEAPGAPGLPAVLADLDARHDLGAVTASLLPLAPALLASRSVTQEAKLQLFEDLGVLRRVDMLLTALGDRPRFGWQPGRTGFVDAWVVAERPFPDGVPWPAEALQGSFGTDDDDFIPARPTWFGRSDVDLLLMAVGHRTERRMTLRVPRMWAGERFVLVLVSYLRCPGHFLQVAVNGRLGLQLWVPFKTDPDGVLSFVFEAPAWLLRTGGNRLDVRVVALVDRFAFDSASLIRAVLLPGTVAEWLPRFRPDARRLVERPSSASDLYRRPGGEAVPR